MKTYVASEVKSATLEYFNGDELAVNVWMEKYALRNNEGQFLEKTPDDMHKRLAREFARIEQKYINPLSEEDIYLLLKDFKKIIPQGSPMFGIGNNFTIQSLSNCFTLEPVIDSYSGILKTDQELVQIAKRRGGIGFDISNLRPNGFPTKNAAITSSGIGPFMERFSNSCREVAQSGRRGALLLSISVHHPEIRTFINIKRNLKKVTGANISIRLTDEFMNAVKNNEKFQLRFPVDNKENPKLSEFVDAKELWNEIIQSAWQSAEPGLLFWDTILKETPSDVYFEEGFRSVGVNPCAELILSSEDACRLLLVNLLSYVENPFTENAQFNYDEFYQCVKKAQRLMDDIVDLEIECIDKILVKIEEDPENENVKFIEKKLWQNIKKKTELGRRTGTGITAVGDALASLNIQYGSKQSIEVIEKIYKTLSLACYESTIQLSKERGSFPIFSYEKEKNHKFIQRVVNCLSEDVKNDYQQYGRRNIALTTTAPGGSVSCLTRTTSGIEPAFLLEYKRRKKINSEAKDAKVDFVDEIGDSWQEYKIYHPSFKKWMDITGKTNVEESPYWKATSSDIDWKASIDLQAAAQRWICHAISKTCNLPAETTKDLISEIYMKAWECGCKGFTIYRDGSRSGVLVSEEFQKKRKNEFLETLAPKRPQILKCDIHHMTCKGEKWVILVGLLDGKPFETIGGLSSYIEIPKTIKKGKLRKNRFKTKNNTYDLILGEGENEFLIKDIVKIFDNPNYAVVTRMISLSLRHGAKINFVVEQLLKDKEADLGSFAKCVARVLKSYIKDGDKVCSDKQCPSCTSESGMVYREGCVTCLICGFSKCG
jgi:ribonucleoside-diphosphate reductase alpha chain